MGGFEFVSEKQSYVVAEKRNLVMSLGVKISSYLI